MGTEILSMDEIAVLLDQLHRTRPGDTGDAVWRTVQAIIKHDGALRTALAASEAATTTYLGELCEVVGIINDDDGPPSDEYALGDAKTGVLLTIAAKEKAEGEARVLRDALLQLDTAESRAASLAAPKGGEGETREVGT